MSAHRRFQRLAATALDFGSSAAEAEELAAHLDTCAACRRFAVGLRSDEERVRARSRHHAPDRVRQVIVTTAYRPAPASHVRRTLSVAGAAVIVLAILAGWGWLNRPRTEGPAQLPVRTWVPLGDVSPFANGWVADVLGTGANLIAVGSVPEGGRQVAAAWMSADGLSWQRLPVDASFGAWEALNLAVHGDTLIVLGAGVAPQSTQSAGTVRVLLTHQQRTCDSCSAPPSSPSQVASISFPHPGGTAPLFSAIAAGGPAFVFVGTEIANPAAGDTPVGAIVATSADGLTWAFNDPTGPEFVGGSMKGVAAGPSGFVAVGQTALAPSVWTSADGRTWTRRAGSILPATASTRSVAAGPSGFVAVGDYNGSAVSWTSADGRSWQAAPASPVLANARMLRVTWLGSEFVAIGESGGDGIAWSSVDGLTWTRLETGSIFAGAQMWAAASIRSRDVLFGTDPSNRAVIAIGEASPQP